MTPLAKHYLAMIPSCICALTGTVLAWVAQQLISLSLWLERTWPKP